MNLPQDTTRTVIRPQVFTKIVNLHKSPPEQSTYTHHHRNNQPTHITTRTINLHTSPPEQSTYTHHHRNNQPTHITTGTVSLHKSPPEQSTYTHHHRNSQPTHITTGTVNLHDSPPEQSTYTTHHRNRELTARAASSTDVVFLAQTRVASSAVHAVVTVEGGGLTACAVYVLVAIAGCLLYTSPSPRDRHRSRMPSSA